MKLSQLGEFGLIDKLAKTIKAPRTRVKIGIGDDAAIIKTSKNILTVLTTDTLVEGVHFDLKYSTFFELGWKMLAVNISDVAAMGGIPTEALITLGLSKKVKVEDVLELYKGLKKLARRYKIDIVGGDMVSSPKGIILSVTILGEAKKNKLLLRSGAKVGDLILVTGDLGASELGLRILRNGKRIISKAAKYAVKRHLLPEPRVQESKVIAASGLATSMIDISDGLVRSLAEVGKLSKTGSLLWQDAVPIKRNVKDIAKKLRMSATDLSLHGGEDYELLLTCSKKCAMRLVSLVERKTGTRLTPIGEVTRKAQGIKLLTKKGKKIPLKLKGYEHFKG